MPSDSTRRDFVGLGVAGLTALAQAVPASAQTPGPITVRQTAGEKRFAEEPALNWRPGVQPSDDAIAVDATRTYQEILGFGGALTDASAYMIDRLDPAAREQFLHELFHPSELGIGATRICIGSSDYATEMFSYDEGDSDPELKRFSIDHDRAYVIPQLLSARKNNPSLFILASPWSPPGWMKNGGSMLGGNLKPVNFPVYAKYLAKFLETYAAAGVKVDAITSQNEVDTDQAGRMPACAWAQEHEVAFVGKHFGPALSEAGLDAKIWLLDHNFNLWGRAYNTLEDPDVFKYADGIAWHPYVGSVTAMSRIHDAYPGKQQYITEGDCQLMADLVGPIRFAATPGPMTEGAGAQNQNRPRRAQDPAAVIATGGLGGVNALRNWACAIINWNLVLDEKGTPNIGPFHGPGMITIHSQTREITRGPNYWVLKHFAHAAARGAKVIDSRGSIEKVGHLAIANPDGRISLVVSNTGAARKVQVWMGGAAAEVTLPANSLTNLSWS
jgi:glucosylceramidase